MRVTQCNLQSATLKWVQSWQHTPVLTYTLQLGHYRVISSASGERRWAVHNYVAAGQQVTSHTTQVSAPCESVAMGNIASHVQRYVYYVVQVLDRWCWSWSAGVLWHLRQHCDQSPAVPTLWRRLFAAGLSQHHWWHRLSADQPNPSRCKPLYTNHFVDL